MPLQLFHLSTLQPTLCLHIKLVVRNAGERSEGVADADRLVDGIAQLEPGFEAIGIERVVGKGLILDVVEGSPTMVEFVRHARSNIPADQHSETAGGARSITGRQASGVGIPILELPIHQSEGDARPDSAPQAFVDGTFKVWAEAQAVDIGLQFPMNDQGRPIGDGSGKLDAGWPGMVGPGPW